MPIPPPGWYPDPAGSELYRWWDGSTWTDALSVSQHARPPAHAAAAGPETDETPVRATGPTTAGVETLDVGPRGRLARPMAAVVVLALLAVTALGVGALLWQPERDRASNAGSAPPTAGTVPSPSDTVDPSSGVSIRSATPGPSVPPGWVDQRTGSAQIGDAAMTLPGDPYEIDPDAGRVGTAVDARFAANAPVHPDYRGTNSWYSTVALLHVSGDGLASDPRAAGQGAMTSLLGWLFPGSEVTLRNVSSQDASVNGHGAVRLYFQAWYDIDGLSSTHDDVSVVVVALSDGSYAAALSSVPDDAPEIQRTMAGSALGTLTVR